MEKLLDWLFITLLTGYVYIIIAIAFTITVKIKNRRNKHKFIRGKLWEYALLANNKLARTFVNNEVVELKQIIKR